LGGSEFPELGGSDFPELTTASADWSTDSEEVAFAKTLARGAVSGKTAFCFLLCDEKLLGRVRVLIRIAAALRRLVATTL
jgi:hypothetical protein